MTGWEMFAFFIVSALLSYAMAPKQQSRKPEAFDEIEFPQADEGTPQAVTFGDCWSGDWMVLAYGNYRTEEVRTPNDKK